MTTETLPSKPSLLGRKLLPGVTVATMVLIAIMVLSTILHFVNMDSIGDANAYYTAAVKSMLMSWKNFFFVAAEPGGSVTVDKPPLGLWIEAVFAYFLGVSGFSVSLPNILAGVLDIPLLYVMVRKYMGELAGLAAALVMALTPVFVATNRNNTMDGMLVFFLLLAAWAFIRATETGKLRWVLVGAFVVGLGFNIKMLQAYLPLPAFYALYFLGSKESWRRKVLNLGIATILLLIISLSWAIVVDLTPADQRPYIGSSRDNTVMGLITGHNGTSRLFGGFFGRNIFNPIQTDGPASAQDGYGNIPAQGLLPLAPPNGQPQAGNAGGPPQQAFIACENVLPGAACSFNLPNGTNVTGTCNTPINIDQSVCTPKNLRVVPNGQSQPQGGSAGGPPQQALDACTKLSQNSVCSFILPNGTNIIGMCIMPPNSNELACAPQGMIPQNGQVSPDGPKGQGGTPFNNETGTPSVFRFFTQPLSKQMSWLLPFALISLVLTAFASRIRLPLESNAHKSLVLWGGWLITCLVFFSVISGIFHSYYAIMLVPPLAAIVGTGFAQLWDSSKNRNRADILLVLSAIITLAFQAFAFTQYGESLTWIALAGVILLIGSNLLVLTMMRRIARVTILIAMLIAPAYWTTMTAASNGNWNLPTAYQGTRQSDPNPAIRNGGGGQPGSNVESMLVTYLEANTQNMKYLVAVPTAQLGARLVLATGRPVLYMGGFTGQDDVVDAEHLAEMVADGELRYVLYGHAPGKPKIANWLQTSCTVVPEFGQQNNQTGFPPSPDNQAMKLYQCNK